MINKKEFEAGAVKEGLNLSLEGFEDYLRDESKFVGHAHAMIRAKHEIDVSNALRLANRFRTPLTVVSGKTSITGASAPLGGVILNVRELNWIDEDNVENAGVGVVLKDYKRMVEEKGYFYPPDPTSEDSCTLGGTIACNASGSLSYLYGPTREFINGLRVALPDGSVIDIERGQHFSSDGIFRIKPGDIGGDLEHELVIPVPNIPQQPWREVKNAAGLFSSQPMDLIDLFIGGEGILGVALRAKTRLLTKRKPYFALMIFLPSRRAIVSLIWTVDLIRRRFHSDQTRGIEPGLNNEKASSDFCGGDLIEFATIRPSCMEWFGSSTGILLDGPHAEKLKRYYGALYIEQEYSDREDMEMKFEKWSELLENLQGRDAIGSLETEAATDEKHLRALRLERIRVPERLNELIKPGLRKIGTDLAVPMNKLDLLMKMYDDNLPEGASFVFGHIGNAHLHANILAQQAHQIDRYTDLHLEMAKYVCSIGGSVSGEHGIGKLKKKILRTMIGDSGLAQIRKVKSALDPNWILNPGNMIDHD